MKKFSNTYIYIYSAGIVAVVAVLLSVVAMSLREKQNDNIRNEKMQVLLQAIGVDCTRDEAAKMYLQYFDQELTVGTNGTTLSIYNVKSDKMEQGETRAFNIKLKEQQTLEKNGKQGAFPVYVFSKDGKKGFVIPTQGTGLWGAVYSNIALADDLNTVVGVTFSHDGETPGLGAEISTEKFQAPFIGKQILDENGQVVSIAIKKNADATALHEVDAITGGTMTSNGVDEMLRVDLLRYQKFIDANRVVTATTLETVAEENANEEEVSHE